jgi:hypothetical protein
MPALQLPHPVPLHGEYDVIVFGGGAAGCTAAIQAARYGKRTALVEKNGVLGGTTIVASVNFPGLFHAWGKQIIRGIGWEIIERTAELGGAKLPDFATPPPRHWHHQILVNRFIYSCVLDSLCVDAGVQLRLHEMPAIIIKRDGENYVALAGKSGLKWFKTAKIVDATGDANIVGMMGYPRNKGDLLQPGTLIHDLAGYDPNAVDAEKFEQLFQEAVRSGKISDEYLRKSGGLLYQGFRTGRISLHVQGIDGSESESKTLAELRARRLLLNSVQFLRTLPGCENLKVQYFAIECGIRETWTVEGEAMVNEQAYTTGYLWPDAVCYSFYPIDLHHHSDNRIRQKMLDPGVIPTIPYRALIPQGSDDLLAAGRCISGDRMANSAYRVQATCMATGQVAGLAAAIAADERIPVNRVPVDRLREQLQKYGAIVPTHNSASPDQQ